MNRRSFLACSLVPAIVTLSGCTFGREDHYPLLIENNSNDARNVSVTITDTVGRDPREFFAREISLDADDSTQYDEAIITGDAPPEQVEVFVVIDGTQTTEETDELPEEEIRIVIEGPENATIGFV
ncbi:hypothetical protein [Natronosalvus rutilus]|uniref:Uncharacterized protein n=1 Tax=Natronosalvus rutilus TaxID=2953753 RepID=A0A9E7N9H0_9EURY|nr:hypothetical protein [Natronosalvus rutilus]UTF53251.1 hypothetical protein NGM29_15980 [Natronosalvus rutilus]